MNTVPVKGDWPRWSISESGYAGIAAYTAIEPPRRLQFARADAWMRTHDPDGEPLPGRIDHARELLRDLYTEFRTRGYTYNIEAEPWSVDQGKSAVRDPFAIAHGSGTCLDFAVMFAAICKLNLLRPIVLLLERERDAPDGTGKRLEAHAIVVVDLFAGTDQPWGEAGYGDPWHVALNPLLSPGLPPDAAPAAAEAAAAAVAWSDAAVHHGWRLGGRFVAVDVTAAARAAQPLGSDFATACRGGEELLRAEDPGRTVAIEVIGANISGVVEFSVSAEGAERRALHTDLPAPAGDFLRFPSRSVREDTFAPGQRIVLLGHSGSGKSWLARHIAGQTNDDFGWWLDASSRSTLVGWLADAHSRELGLSTTQTRTKDDQQSLADGAVRRLDEAVGSWVVVYDNADGDPDEIDKLLPARPKENQLLVVTTTNKAWDRPGWRVVMVDAVPPAELAEHFKQDWNEQVRGLLGGLPLLAAATRTFAATVGEQWWEIEPPHEGDLPVDVPARIWTAVVRRLGRDSPVCRAAQSLAWLPPVTVPVAALAEVVPGFDGAAQHLTGYGLADAVVGSTDLRMHRLFSSAIREVGTFVRGQQETGAFLAASAVLRNEASLNLLALHFDRRTIDALRGAVTATWREPYQRAVDLHRLGVAVERHDPEGAAKFLTLARELVGAPIEGTEESECVRINVDGLRALARPAARRLGRNATSEEVESALDQAIAWCIEAEELCADRADDHWPMTLARTQALHGIAVRGKGGLHKNRDRRRATELFEQSRVLLEESYRIRQVLDDGKGGFDVDRAQFNLAGLEVEFAQVDRRSKAAEHLVAARRHYSEVLEARRRRLRSDDYEDVACCHNGLAIVEYYTAVLVDQTPVEQARSLRSAAAYATKAADIRVRLQPLNSYDGADASKSVALLAKISLARLEVNQAGTGSGAFPFDYLAQFGLEWSGLAPGSALTLGADGKAVVAEAAVAPRFKAVPAVGEQDDLRAGIAGWIGSLPMRALVEAFAREDEDWEQLFDSTVDLAQRLAELEAFTDRWDTRGGRERNLAAALALTPRQSALALNAAEALGLRSPGAPKYEEYDHVILLGGLIRACFLRPAHAARMLARGEVRTRSVVALGARRKLGGDELDFADALGEPDLKERDEFAALDRGTRVAFGLGDPDQVRGEPASELLGPYSGWEERVYLPARGPRIVVAAAPSRRPAESRADTADGYAWFADGLAELTPGQRILAVTTDIYRPYQHLAALRMLALPYAVEIETVGHVPSRVEPNLRQSFSPAKYLQEIRSAVLGCRALHAAVAEHEKKRGC